MNEVTHILKAIEQGDPQAAAQLLSLVYDELRRLAAQKLAHERPGLTLQPTALVHEAYLRLVAGGDATEHRDQSWAGRGHFFAAAEAMRRILIESARRKQRRKHGGGRKRVDLAEQHEPVQSSPVEKLALTRISWPWIRPCRAWPKRTPGRQRWSDSTFSPACPGNRSRTFWEFRAQPLTGNGPALGPGSATR
jgi:RNA polymerase sigma factor (TIGR02999 family)